MTIVINHLIKNILKDISKQPAWLSAPAQSALEKMKIKLLLSSKSQRESIAILLSGLLQIAAIEDTNDQLSVKRLANLGEYQPTDLFNHFLNKDFIAQYLAPFNTQILSANGVEYYVFPELTEEKNSKGQARLKCLLDFCHSHSANLDKTKIEGDIELDLSPEERIEIEDEDFNVWDADYGKFPTPPPATPLVKPAAQPQSIGDSTEEASEVEKNASSTQVDEVNEEEKTSCCSEKVGNISLMVLGGFVACLGIAAIAFGIVLLLSSGAAPLAAVSIGIGAGLLLIGGTTFGVGFFTHRELAKAKAADKLQSEVPNFEVTQQIDFSSEDGGDNNPLATLS